MQILSDNLKRLRLAKHLTQEQAAEALGVSTQTVSRWECHTTLPDASILPQIARLYCVTIDDLYRQSSVAYENYASRLLSVFEASHKPEDFMQAYTEYQKLLKSGVYTANDLRCYAILHQYMMTDCMKKAEELFNRVLKQGRKSDPETYWRVQRQKSFFLSQIGRNHETVQEFLPAVEQGSSEVQEWICLLQAYSQAGDHDAAWALAQKAFGRFPENACLHIYTGDLLRAMKRYDEAFFHWQRALELEPEWLDAAYSMGFCYEELGDYEKACDVWEKIADNLASRGFEAEVNWPRSMAESCRKRLKT